jgi:5'-methylthioadenosine phosphorylase
MTNMPEAALAREAELCYASVAMVTDYDSWRPAEEGANVADILDVMHGNSANARALVAAVAAAWAPSAACPQGCDHALDHAIITDPALWPPPVVETLRGVAGRVLK